MSSGTLLLTKEIAQRILDTDDLIYRQIGRAPYTANKVMEREAIEAIATEFVVCVEAERLAELQRDAERWRAVESATEILSAGAGSPLTTDRNWWRASIPAYNGQIYAETLTRLADEIIKAKAREALAAKE